MKAISNDMLASTTKVEAAMRNDFQKLLTHDKARMLGLLLGSDPGKLERWMQLLMGETPTSPGNADV